MTQFLNQIQRTTATAALFLVISAGVFAAQTPSPATAQTPAVQTTADSDFVGTQEQLLKLLKMSPTLTQVVARDPSLLSNQEYVNRNNPQLGQFLIGHPEVARNPGFYLFTNLPPGRGGNEEALEHKVWPEMGGDWRGPTAMDYFFDKAGPFLVFFCAVGTLMWILRMLTENRRWSRIFKLQTEVHGKLIEKFSNNQDLLTYMDTEAGRKFLEAAPIPINFEEGQRMPNAVARVLMPMQIGVVLSLLGIGLLFLRYGIPDQSEPLLLLGVLALMPGIGFILSAAMTWVLAGRLGLMPPSLNSPRGIAAPSAGFDGRER